MKYVKSVNLGGISFEEHTSHFQPVEHSTGCNRYEIFELYGRPSQTKVSIWHDWCDWCDKMNNLGYSCGIQIESHSSSFFTITGSLRKDNEVIALWITAMHNRAILAK